MQDVHLTTVQVANLLQLSPSTLKKWRNEGRGPRWLRLGSRRIRYREADVESWLTQQRRQTWR